MLNPFGVVALAGRHLGLFRSQGQLYHVRRGRAASPGHRPDASFGLLTLLIPQRLGRGAGNAIDAGDLS